MRRQNGKLHINIDTIKKALIKYLELSADSDISFDIPLATERDEVLMPYLKGATVQSVRVQ